ncbi:hypothetical protein BMEII0480 [Brucella melitensis bv. 1 str. 16M]|uniref:Uncharacterized protein n=1 Tax=Brucella melitensis biotype 1 (strain ATCC 23456 / CCUG 17765 / NCTC 10094 / 16M) TaxID=224914 RepID=Q8YCP8_BRUME|nr:hypothetical protein BMEII0480 [Brucella melitensis bv. 1 str. 16M]
MLLSALCDPKARLILSSRISLKGKDAACMKYLSGKRSLKFRERLAV